VLLVAVLYTRHVNERARNESNFSVRATSEMLALALRFEDDDRFYDRLRPILDRISVEAPFPIIIIDTEGRPIWWKVTGFESHTSYGFDKLSTFSLASPPDDRIARLMVMVAEFRSQDRAVVFYYPDAPSTIQGYVCYGESDLARRLGNAIILQLGMLLIFFLVGVLGFFLMKRYEQESIWVGMAKETAHQMGTPLTSLLGWIQLSESRLEDESLVLAEKPREAFKEAMSMMAADVDRLEKVSARFNNIGGSPALKRADLRSIVEYTVGYFRSRLPQRKVQVEIREQYDEVPMVKIHAELIEWVVENLIKNALDSIDKEQGVISLSLSYNSTERTVDLHVRDNGRGMSPSQRRKIFRPGYSLKSAGWGLGLTLSRRVVEEYHGGHLKLLDTHEGHGSCFVVRLPI
jgi:signal transduction histidine kinase